MSWVNGESLMTDYRSKIISNYLPTINDWIDSTLLQRSQQQILNHKAVLSTDVGLIRKENQDRVAALQVSTGSNPFVCIALSDGMGGMKDGGPCATTTLAAFFDSLIENSKLTGAAKLEVAVRVANDEVFRNWQGKGGATLSAVLIEANQLFHVANVGDSRIYVVDKEWETIRRVTVDDSLKEAFGGEDRRLVQFIGIGNSLLPRIDRVPSSADTFVVTSDGAHYFNQLVFDDLILKAGEPLRAAERLVALARWLGGPDNASVAAFKAIDVVHNLTNAKAPFATMWSGISQLHIPISPIIFNASNAEPQPTSTHPSIETQQTPSAVAQKRSSPKRKIKMTKKSTPDNQLEINISSDENDDASDS
jgi:PPM family protein phosphatase